MKINKLLYSTCVVLMCACGSNNTTTTPEQGVTVAESFTTIGQTQASPEFDDAEEYPVDLKDEKIVIKEVLDLLLKEKEIGLKSSMLDYFNFEGNQAVVEDEENGEENICVPWYEVSCFKKKDGTYQVLCLYLNDGCELPDRRYTYLYDGEKLMKNDFQFPLPKYIDFLNEGLIYYGLEPATVARMKTEVIDINSLRYSCFHNRKLRRCLTVRSGFGSGKGSSFYDTYLKETFDRLGFDNLRLEYIWNGESFVLDKRNRKLRIVGDGVGNLLLGESYTGQPVDGYEIKKNNNHSYDLVQKGRVVLKITTNSENNISAIDIYSPKFMNYADFGLEVGADRLNEWFKTCKTKMKNENGIVFFELFSMRCSFNYDDIESCRETEDGYLTDVVVKDGTNLTCITLGKH